MSVRTHSGFTLLELLLAILIIGVLAGLLFPVFRAARKDAGMARCSANLRQLGMAYGQYAADYGSYPEPARLVQSVGNRSILTCPEDDGSQPAASSYTFRSLLPPDFSPYWLQPELAPDTVLAVCNHHLERRFVQSGSARTLSPPAYPYKLALRAGGAVERLHLTQIRELLVPGERPMFVRVYPREPGYEQGRRLP